MKAFEEVSRSRVRSVLQVRCRVLEIDATVLEMSEKVPGTIPQTCIEGRVHFAGEVCVQLFRPRPPDPQNTVNIPTPLKAPIVNKLTHARADDIVEPGIFKDFPVFSIDSKQFEHFGIGLEYKHTCVRFQALTQMHPGIAQAPSEVKDNVGFFQR